MEGKHLSIDMLSMFCLFLFDRNLDTVLVQRGVLKKGTILLAGQSVARVNFFIKKKIFYSIINLGSSFI